MSRFLRPTDKDDWHFHPERNTLDHTHTSHKIIKQQSRFLCKTRIPSLMPRKAASRPVWALRGPLVPEGHQQRRHHGKGRARGKGRCVSFHTYQWSPLYLEKEVPRKQLIKGSGANSARGACGVVLLGCEAGPAPVQPRSAQRVCPGGRPLLWAAAFSSRGRLAAGRRSRKASGRHLHSCRCGWRLSFSTSSSSVGSSRTALKGSSSVISEVSSSSSVRDCKWLRRSHL